MTDININETWNLLCSKVNLHNTTLAKHKEFIKKYMDMSNNRLGLGLTTEPTNIVKDDEDDKDDKDDEDDKDDKDDEDDKYNISIQELESKIKQLKEIQEKLYDEIKGHVRDCYCKTNYNYDDLEKLFRAHKLGIYLIADKINRDKLIPGTDLLDKESEQVEYKVDFIVTDSNAYYLEQLGIECTEETINDEINRDIIIETVKNNLYNLSLCGDIIVTDEEETQYALNNMILEGDIIEDMNSY